MPRSLSASPTSPVPRCPQSHPERKTELFIEAAQAMGASWAVLSRYLFLNVIQSVPVLFTLNCRCHFDTRRLRFRLGLPEEVAEGHDLRQALEAPTGIWWTRFSLV